ncbi:MAG: DUF547 domain-containing protein [Gammaproteobacteria bacterium]|nr:DUF547 domain-containing protein [Gammaproteobacteria bacterium]
MMKQVLKILMLVAPFTAWAAEPDWSAYAAVLDAHVRPAAMDGTRANMVDYEAIRADARFNDVVRTVREFDVTVLDGQAEHLAFYINAYNILTIQLILDHWPVESIRDIGNIFKGPWDIVMLENADGDLTLDDIEHEIIRSYPEPRIHFAVNCASVGCPDLRREPYAAARLDAQLDAQTRAFLGNPAKGFRLEDGDARVSKIFRWYAEDFEAAGGIGGFVRNYAKATFNDVVPNLPYDWQLNHTER